MLRRLIIGLLPLLVGFSVMLSLPLAGILADRATQAVYLDRLSDADRFATLADRALIGRTGNGWMADELRAYWQVYGIRAWLLRVDGQTLLSGDGTRVPPTLLSRPEFDLASRGVRPNPPTAVTPRGPTQLLVAVPVRAGSEAIGVILTLSSTAKLRQEVLRRWLDLAGAAAVVTALLVATTVPFSRWLLRPVARLEATAGRIAAGDLASRAGLAAGPPELRRLAASFDRMAEVVERTMSRQQQFVGDASHQLRTPLTSMRLAVENLRPWVADEPSGRAAAELDEATREADAMGRMLDGLLQLTRLAAGPGQPERVDEVLAQAANGWEDRCTAAGMRLVVEADEGLVVLTPPGCVRHMLDELVANATRLSAGTLVEVTARALVGPDGVPRVALTVRDDGRGLDAEQRRAASRRFWRAADQQNVPGTGLGLAIVAELATTVGGRLDLEDAGPGLAARLTLGSPPLGPPST